MANSTDYVVRVLASSFSGRSLLFNVGYRKRLATRVLPLLIDPVAKLDVNLPAHWEFFLLKWSLLLGLFVGNGLGLGLKSFCMEKKIINVLKFMEERTLSYWSRGVGT